MSNSHYSAAKTPTGPLILLIKFKVNVYRIYSQDHKGTFLITKTEKKKIKYQNYKY